MKAKPSARILHVYKKKNIHLKGERQFVCKYTGGPLVMESESLKRKQIIKAVKFIEKGFLNCLAEKRLEKLNIRANPNY